MYDSTFIARSHPHSSQYGTFSNDSTTKASWSSLVGIVTAIIGNVIISFALNTQRYAHIRIDREFHDRLAHRKAQTRLSKTIRSYGATAQQEQVAENRAKLNAQAAGPGNDENDNSNAFGQPQHRKSSTFSEETARPPRKEGEEHVTRQSYLKSSIWWIGIVLMAVGETGNFLAYGFAPASIVGPLGVVGIICNCLIAPLMLKEQFRQRDFWGVLIAIGGVVVVVLSAQTSETQMSPDGLWFAIKRWEFLTYIGITLFLIVLLMVASPRYGRKTIWIDLGLVGLFGGYTALSTKGIASMLSASLWKALTFPITYALIVILVLSAVMQIRYLNRALSNFSSTQVIPIQFVLFTLSVIIGSAVLYRDFEKTNLDHAIKFVVGCFLTFSGAWLITSGRKPRQEEEEDDDGEHDETIHLIDEEAEMEEERTTLKHEQPGETGTEDDAPKAKQKEFFGSESSGRSSRAPSIPSVSVDAYEDDLNANPWMSSTEQLDDLIRPRTPSNPRQLLDVENTPYFTPSSAPNTSSQSRVGLLHRIETSPADPQTPTRGSRAPSPPKADIPPFVPGEVYQTPQTGLFRTARGSISRLLPGPFLGTISSSSLNAVVAESLIRGEGSPQGPIRSRSYRRPKLSQVTRQERNRRRSTTAASDADGLDLENGLITPALSTWQTRESLPITRERRATGDSATAGPSSSRPGLLPSLSPSLHKFISNFKDRGKDVDRDRDEQDDGPSTRRRRKS